MKKKTHGNFLKRWNYSIWYWSGRYDIMHVLKSTVLHNIKSELKCMQIRKINQKVRNKYLTKD